MKAPLLRVVVCSSIDGLVPAVKRSLARLQVDVEIEAHSAADYTTAQKETWRNARVVLGDPGLVAPLVDGADSLEFLQSTWAGVDSLVEKSTKRDYVCGKVSGCFGPLMAEYVFAHLLWRSRSFDLLSRQDDEPEWRQAELKSAVRPLTGRKLGFLGAGNICRHVAKVGKAFGLETLALTSTPLGASGFDRTTTSVADVFASSDVVVSALPSTPATRYMLDGGVLRAGARAGKTPPLFINVGRGDFISESELLQALDAKWLDHAVLDVFASEPLAATSPLWRRSDVTVTTLRISQALKKKTFVNNCKNKIPLRVLSHFKVLYAMWHVAAPCVPSIFCLSFGHLWRLPIRMPFACLYPLCSARRPARVGPLRPH